LGNKLFIFIESFIKKTSGVWQVAGDVLLVTRHSTHVTTSKNLHKLVLIKHVLAKAGNGEKKFL